MLNFGFRERVLLSSNVTRSHEMSFNLKSGSLRHLPVSNLQSLLVILILTPLHDQPVHLFTNPPSEQPHKHAGKQLKTGVETHGLKRCGRRALVLLSELPAPGNAWFLQEGNKTETNALISRCGRRALVLLSELPAPGFLHHGSCKKETRQKQAH